MPEYGFNEDSKPVPVTSPASPDTYSTICELLVSCGVTEAQMETIRPELLLTLESRDDVFNVQSFSALTEFFRMMTANATPLQAGQRLFVLAYLAGKLEVTTQRQLAKRLNATPGRVTQIKQSIPSEFRSLFNLRSREAKRRTY